MSERVQSYFDLLDMSYVEAVESLLQKYGPANDDYFREASYQRYLKGEIKSITQGKSSRAKEGLYRHHIDENISMNLCDLWSIKFSKIPFKYQKKERLVYCDLVEHMILHALISYETNGSFGYPGYIILYENVLDWYIEGTEPKKEWLQACKEKAFLTFEEIDGLVFKIESMPFFKQQKIYLISGSYRYMCSYGGEDFKEKYKTVEEYISNFSDVSMVSFEAKKIMEEENKVRENEEIKVNEERELRKQKEISELLVGLKEDGCVYSRQSVLEYLYKYKYQKDFKEFKEFRSSMMPIIKEDLVVELLKILEAISI